MGLGCHSLSKSSTMEVAPPCEFATNARGAPLPLEPPLDSSQILIHIEGRHMVVNLQLIGNAAPLAIFEKYPLDSN